ncbi:MAG: MarR family winged helix-turn-helix transcriptional regulator [Candidatus Acidiferrales bacterium]
MSRGKSLAVADRLHSAAIHLLRRLRRRDLETGVGPAQLSALSVVVFAGPKTLGELARAEQVRPPTMTRIVAGLQRAGLVRRERDAADRRVVRVRATPKGVRVMQAGRRRRIQTLAAQFRRLDARTVTTLGRAASIIEELFEQEPARRRS